MFHCKTGKPDILKLFFLKSKRTFGAITMPKLQTFRLFHVTEVNYCFKFLDLVIMPCESVLFNTEILEVILHVEKLDSSLNYSSHL